MKNKFKQFIALFLCALMVLTSGMFSIGANLAATDDAGSEYAEAEAEATADTASASSETTETAEPETTAAAEETAAPEETAEPAAETTAVPEETAAPEETAEAAASAEPAATAAPVKTEYDYSDDKVTVTATLSDPSIIPDDAELRVTQVTKKSEDYNYDAYMDALNNSAASDEKEYTSKNTLLYDICFIETAEDGTETEVEPAEGGSVSLNVVFNKDQLIDHLDAEKAEDVSVTHLPISDEAKAANNNMTAGASITANDVSVEDVSASVSFGNTEQVDFSTNSLSVYAVSTTPAITAYSVDNFSLQSALGDGYDYGIIANKYLQYGDTETNVMVGTYKSTASEVGASSNYSNAGGDNYFGQFAEGTTYPVRFHQAPRNVYLGTEATKQYENNKNNFFDLAHMSGTNIIKNHDINVSNVINSIDQYFWKKLRDTTDKQFVSNLNSITDSNNQPTGVEINLSGKGPGTYVIYFKGDEFGNSDLSKSVKLNKDNDQTVIFYCTSKDLKIYDYYINSHNANTYVGYKINDADALIQSVIFYAPNASTVNIGNQTAGVFIAPKATFTKTNTSAGILVADKYIGGNGEWHYHNHNLPSPAQFNITATKTLNGKTLAGGDFEFTVTAASGTPMPSVTTVTNAADGSVIFPAITYQTSNAGKTYKYNVSEIPGKEDGITYDKSQYQVEITVSKDNEGNVYISNKNITQLKDSNGTDISDAGNPSSGQQVAAITFANSYQNNASGSLQLNAKKILTGKAIASGEFKFKLKGTNNSTQQIIENDKDGKVTFDPINYTQADIGKTYTYTVSEVKDNEAGMTYDDTVYTVTAVITDSGNGTLSVAKTIKKGDIEVDNIVFNNSYKAEGCLDLSATKTLTGRTLKPGEFSFKVTPEEGTPMPSQTTVTNEADGSITFSPINYTQADIGKTYTYTVSEVKGSETGVTYDDTVYTVTAVITDSGNGTLSVAKTIKKGDIKVDNIVFNNRVNIASVMITGSKTLDGKALPAGDDGMFRFELLENGERIDTAKNDANGNFSFAKITYTGPGEYTYTVREINAGRIINGISYDSSTKTVVVNVTRDTNSGMINATIDQEKSDPISFNNQSVVSRHVVKQWEDDNNANHTRPASITVKLLDNGKEIKSAKLSESNNWSYDFTGLDPEKTYTVKEVMSENNGYTSRQVVSDGGNTITLINTFTKTVNLSAHKTLKGALIQNGEFTFKLVRNSDPDNAYYAVNDGSGNIYFNTIPYDEKGYTVTEVSENGDPHITYDTDAITYDKDGNITSDKKEFINTERPAVLRVQKTSREEPHDPLVGAVYGLYMVGADGTNDVLVEAQTSDANGYMYYTKFQEGVWYYFKEISAPAGHEVDPYPGQKFEIKYQNDGSLAMVGEDGKAISTADITDSTSTAASYVQINTTQTDLNSITADEGHVKLTSDSDGVKAVAVAVAGALPADTQLQVTKVNLSETAEANLEKQVGKVKSVAYYDVSFISNGAEVEPEAGSVTVTIQEDNGTAISSDVNPSNLKIVHLLDDQATGVAPVYGSIEVNGNTLYGASVTSSSFSIFGVVEPEDMTAFNSNYLLTASGVSDKVSKVQIAKLDTSGKYVIGADLQIIEKNTGKVVAEWNTSEGNKVFNRFFSEDEPLNVDTDYILHEVSAPEGYQKADDIVFRLNKYDSSLSIWKYDEKGNLVEDTKSADEAVTDFTLTMTDKPIKVEKDKVYKQKTVHKDTVLYKNNEVTETVTTTDKKGNKVTVTRYGTNTVNTGVANHTGMYITLIVIAAAAVIVITVLKNRKNAE
jgi:pilin isopeptide linkage protein